ncbi:hypothetical protein cand_010340 [Cryptosporidium andersoni]|uniref:Transcription factor CBF/NF-Y/archaeal histone domain-containing protein n=1 Tax=Cryptosporidium andersoni TaxID=117008 RepID=A0A1J4MIS5_9CRYT|nr:hypothetical protein cand_010340 [Cryptosporidium andersoni]
MYYSETLGGLKSQTKERSNGYCDNVYLYTNNLNIITGNQQLEYGSYYSENGDYYSSLGKNYNSCEYKTDTGNNFDNSWTNINSCNQYLNNTPNFNMTNNLNLMHNRVTNNLEIAGSSNLNSRDVHSTSLDMFKNEINNIPIFNEDELQILSRCLPHTRIKKIMKYVGSVKHMIGSEVPALLAIACELFVRDLTNSSWKYTQGAKRRTLQAQDIKSGSNSDIRFRKLFKSNPVLSLKYNNYYYSPSSTKTNIISNTPCSIYNNYQQQCNSSSITIESGYRCIDNTKHDKYFQQNCNYSYEVDGRYLSQSIYSNRDSYNSDKYIQKNNINTSNFVEDPSRSNLNMSIQQHT